MEEWGMTGLFAGSFLAATILPFSSEVLFFTFLKLGYEPYACLILASIGNSLGGFTNLLLGRFSHTFFQKSRNASAGERTILRYGAWVAWWSWVPFIGDPLLIAAGYFRTPFITTTVFMIAGKTLRYVFLLYLFYSTS